MLANAIAGALNLFPEVAGSVSALIGASQFGAGILGSAAVGYFAGGTPRPLGLAMAFFGVGCALCALILVWRIRPKAVTNLHQVDDAPLHHVAMPDSMSSSPLVAALDPRVDEQVVQDQMQTTVPEAEDEPEQSPEESLAAETEPEPEHPDPDDHPHDLSRARP